ncbi:MAG: hypothetical protein J7L15_08895 [Clostridiales bacterium]|nr:hypothetical protein [Clostridiales bacterium]
MTNQRNILVCCKDCKFFKLQSVEGISTEHLEGKRYNTHFTSSLMSEEEKETIKEENRIHHHRICIPSGTCSTKIQMCNHKDCFAYESFALMGMPCARKVRVKGQAQFNSFGKCKRYQRKFWKITKLKKADL